MNEEKTSSQLPRSVLIFLAFALFAVFLGGIAWLAMNPLVPGGGVGALLSFVAGLSMIFLPCTFPLVFVIVPMAMKERPVRGILMAVSFGIGLSVTLSVYGVTVAVIGKWLGMDSITRSMFAVAGILAYIFGLYQLKLGGVKIPAFKQGLPVFVQKQSDVLKTFFMGLFLGNAGVGCPNPAFYVLLVYIAGTADPATGLWLGFVHGLGRAVPLVLITLLAIIGFNTVHWVAAKRKAVDAIMGWMLVSIGIFIFQYGLFGMYWWEESFIHKAWNRLIETISPRLGETMDAANFFGVMMPPSEIEKYVPYAPWIAMILFFLITLAWHRCKRKAEKQSAGANIQQTL